MAQWGRRSEGVTRWTSGAIVRLAAVVAFAGCAAEAPAGERSGNPASEAPGPSGVSTASVVPAASADVPESWHLGRAATEAEMSAIDIDIMPDGRGLPPGSGDHATGADVYRTTCAPCHGVAGEGTPLAGALVAADPEQGFRGRTVGHFWPYATTAFDYVRRAMPWDAPGTLTDDQVYAVVAWILAENGVIEENAVMDAGSLAAVVMPGQERFVRDDRTGGPVIR